jgi:hypothetical protein
VVRIGRQRDSTPRGEQVEDLFGQPAATPCRANTPRGGLVAQRERLLGPLLYLRAEPTPRMIGPD